MNYLAKLKEKIGKATPKAAPFVTFDTPLGEHVDGLEIQPTVVYEPKITNTSNSVKSDKRVSFRGEAPEPATFAAAPKYASPRSELTAAPDATVPAYRAALAYFKDGRHHGVTRFRHDQAFWAAEMFLNEWEGMAADYDWPAADIFDLRGLAYWLGVELVTALGPEHAVTETRRVYDRLTHKDWTAQGNA